MNVLVACEYSGRVRDAFIAKGHNAISCDIIPSIAVGPHILGDVREWLDREWDMLIAFPPCTYLTAVANAYWWRDGRMERRREALEFVNLLLRQDHIPMIALENPVGAISTEIRRPDQVIHPWWFGEPYTKKTCLWLKGLPRLKATEVIKPIGPWVGGGNRGYGAAERKDRRSLTFRGIAEAMASQWG